LDKEKLVYQCGGVVVTTTVTMEEP